LISQVQLAAIAVLQLLWSEAATAKWLFLGEKPLGTELKTPHTYWRTALETESLIEPKCDQILRISIG
jgi:hypothetical protein